jgi:hypothetical protein
MFLKTKEEIVKWLDKYEIKNYIISDDLTVAVDGDVFLYDKNIINISIKFNIVIGDFNCSYNRLTSIEGAPEKVGGYFSCSHNKLTSLQGAPKEVGGGFYCDNNKLINLQGAPKEVGGGFDCSFNKLTSLQGVPEKIDGNFYCYNNLLTTLQGAPKNKLKQIIKDYPHLTHTLSTEDLLEII